MAGSSARMTDEVKASCYAMYEQGMSPTDIAKVVKKTDKSHPTEGAVRYAIKTFGSDIDCSKLGAFRFQGLPDSWAPFPAPPPPSSS